MSRTANFIANTKWKVIAQALTAAMNMVNRYCFIVWMGAEFLGVIGLFNSILGVLAFADLGLSSAFSACFYRSIANNDVEHSVRLINVLEKSIRKIMLVMFVAGVAVIPFVQYLISGAEQIDLFHLRLYYFLFLVDMVNSYLYMSKVCYVTALQHEFVLAPITTLFSAAKILVGLVLLYFTHSYAAYLIAGIVVVTVQRFVLNDYIGRKYPETKVVQKDGKLDAEDRDVVYRNVKATLSYKLSSTSVLQLGNILISMKVSIIATGLVSNYVALKTIVFNLLYNISASLLPGLGNVLASESRERQLETFDRYLVMHSFLCGGSFIGLTLLSTPFIMLYFGESATLAMNIVFTLNFSAYIMNLNSTLSNLTISAGRYNIGMSFFWIEAIVNLVISVFAVEWMGILGVYVALTVAELVVYIAKPFVVMYGLYQIPPKSFFCITGKGIVTTLLLYIPLRGIYQLMLDHGVTWPSFIVLSALCAVVFVGGYSLLWCRDRQYKKLMVMGFGLTKQTLQGLCAKGRKG